MANKKKNVAPAKKSNGAMKLWIIIGIVAALFALIIILTNQSNSSKKDKAMELYGTEDLQQVTYDLLNDENYQNIILPDALEEKIASGEGTFAYMFSPTCVHCKNFTPKLMPLADENDIQIDQLNVYEFTNAWDTYSISATPTLIYFKDGQEVDRLVGDADEATTQQFFDSVLTN